MWAWAWTVWGWAEGGIFPICCPRSSATQPGERLERERERTGVKRGEEREETEDQRDSPTTVLSLELLPLDWDSSVLPLTLQDWQCPP